MIWLLLCGLALLAGLTPSSPQAAAPAGAAGRQAILLDISGAIGPAATEYLLRGQEIAAARDAAMIIIRLDTPGGLVSSMRDINRAILASPIPILVFVAPAGAQAASAGTYIVYASHLAAMAPGTNIGAATPVQMGGAPPGGAPQEKPDDKAKPAPVDASGRKAENDAVAYIRSLAGLQGRNADWAETAVREAASLPASQALEHGVVELIAQNVDDLLAQADGRSVNLQGKPVTLSTQGLEVVPIEPNWRARLLSVLTNPNLAYILLLLGIYGIIFEFLNPGAVLPGTLGAVALVTALLAFNMLPISMAGVGLLLLGIVLMVAEAFVTTAGLLGISGLVIFAVGSFFLFDGDVPGFTLSPVVIVVAALVSLALLAAVLASVLRARRHRVVSGDAGFIGSRGEVRKWSDKKGMVQVQGELWQAHSDHVLQPGATIRVTQREGLMLTVVPQPDPEKGE